MGRVAKLRLFAGAHGRVHYELAYITDSGEIFTSSGEANYGSSDHAHLLAAINSFVAAEYAPTKEVKDTP